MLCRLSANHVGELRLARVEDFRHSARVRDQISEHRAVRLVAMRPLGGADQIEFAMKVGGLEEIVVDIRYDGQTVLAC